MDNACYAHHMNSILPGCRGQFNIDAVTFVWVSDSIGDSA